MHPGKTLGDQVITGRRTGRLDKAPICRKTSTLRRTARLGEAAGGRRAVAADEATGCGRRGVAIGEALTSSATVVGRTIHDSSTILASRTGHKSSTAVADRAIHNSNPAITSRTVHDGDTALISWTRHNSDTTVVGRAIHNSSVTIASRTIHNSDTAVTSRAIHKGDAAVTSGRHGTRGLLARGSGRGTRRSAERRQRGLPLGVRLVLVNRCAGAEPWVGGLRPVVRPPSTSAWFKPHHACPLDGTRLDGVRAPGT